MAHIQLLAVSEGKSDDGKIWKFPYAFPIIIRALMDTGHSFDVLDLHLHKKSEDELFDYLDTCKAKIYGISAFSFNYSLVKEMSKRIKHKHPDATIIVGGVLSGNDDELMNHTEVDIVCTSAEGEKVLPKILEALDASSSLQSVHGLTYKNIQNNKIIKTPKRRLMAQVEYQKEPRPAYEYFDEEIKELVQNLNSKNDLPVKGFPLLTMRGCPFDCTFCGHLYGRKFLRKNWDAYFDELEFLMERYDIKGFYSFDTNQFLTKKDVDDYSTGYSQRNSTFKMVVELRTTFGDYEMFKKLKEHGIEVISFGLESGSQIMLDNMKKHFKLENVKKILKAALDADIIINGNFIFGTPGENIKTIRETRDFMLLLRKWIYQQKKRFKEKGKLIHQDSIIVF